jgi:hypothetical protein
MREEPRIDSRLWWIVLFENAFPGICVAASWVVSLLAFKVALMVNRSISCLRISAG